MINFDNNKNLDKFYKRCRWASVDSIGDTYCVNDISFHCGEFVGSNDDEICSSCVQFYSCVDEENNRILDKNTNELF